MRRLGHHDLVLSHFSLPRGTSLEARVAAAASAGFAGIGWYVAEYVELLRRGGTDAAIRAVLDDHDVVLHEVDALPLDRLQHLDAAVHLATTFGAHHVQVQGNRPGTVAEAAAVIADLADRLRPCGCGVAIEFIPANNVASPADALELAERSGRPNVGLQVDVWHHVRGVADWELLASLAPERILSVQLDDGPREPVEDDYLRDTVHHRCPPGEGEFDLPRFLAAVHPPSSPLPLSLEVIDDDLAGLEPAIAARRMADATRRVLASLPGAAA